MKKENKSVLIAIAIIMVITIAVSIISFVVFGKVSLSHDAKSEFYFDSGDIYFTSNMSDEHCATIANMFDSKRLISSNDQNKIFSDKIYLSFDDGNEIKNFYIACDGSGTIRFNDKYFDLSEEESTEFFDILSQYTAKFPCI